MGAVVRGIERTIRAEKIVKAPHSLDGEAYVCATENPYIRPELATIYCLIPPTMGF